MHSQEYRQNRARLLAAELASHNGQWVAISLDGRRISVLFPFSVFISDEAGNTGLPSVTGVSSRLC